MDAGDLCYGHSVQISSDDTSGSLFKKLENEAAIGLDNFLDELITSKGDLTYTPQYEDLASFAPTIKKTDGLINPIKENYDSLNNKLRAYTPWPGLYLFLDSFRLKVHEIEQYPMMLNPGEVNISQGPLLIGLSDGKAVRLKTVQAEGKKAQSDNDWLNGIRNKVSSLSLNKEHYE